MEQLPQPTTSPAAPSWDALDLPTWGRAFLTSLGETGSVRAATEAARIDYSTPYAHAKKYPDFDVLWGTALNVAADRLEEEARRRAVEGVEEPVFQNGKQVGTKRVYSDSLLAMLLRGAKPDKYKDRSAVDVNAKVTAGPAYDLSVLSDAELAELERISHKAAQVLPASGAAQH